MYNANLTCGGDAELAFRIARDNKVGFIDKVGAGYRVHDSNLHNSVEWGEVAKVWDVAGKYDSLSRAEKREIRLKKADALRCAGYEYFERNNFKRARELFSRSLRLKKSYFALKYLFIMASVPEKIIRLYRENRRLLANTGKPAGIPLKHEKPFVSVVVPALNSEKTIGKCLESLQEQDYPKERYEIIVVDNGSKDRTAEIAKPFNARLYRKPKLGVSGLRNFGAGKSKGEIIAFADSDCVVGRKWIWAAVDALSNLNASCTGFMYSPAGKSWVANAWQLSLERNSRDRRLVPGGNIIVKKKAFDDIGGFDAKLGSGEDQDFCFRLIEGNYAIVPDKRLRSIHLGEQSTLWGFFAKQFSYGRWGIAFMKKHLMGLPASTAAMFGIYTLFAAAGTIFGIAALILLGWKIPLILFAGLFAFPPLLMSISVSVKSGRIRHAHHLFALYSAYGAARALALLFQKSGK
jgi:glycosyltransferase involved in cell wall biosynthesis